MGSCPEELGTLCCPLTSQSRKERLLGVGHLCSCGEGSQRWEASIRVLALLCVALDKALAPSLGTLLPVSGSNVESETLSYLPH